jgi:phospholipid transport system transporter-binding protein
MIEENGGALRVSGPMLIANANSLLDSGRALLSANGAGRSVVFDLSAVDGTDSSALSVVFGWLRTARERGVTMRLANPPASMMSQAELYGVSDSIPLA